LPPHLHCPVSVKALEAGKHVICEKPIVLSLDEADRLEAAAEAFDRKVFPVFQYRYGRGMEQLKALQNAGVSGKAYVASIETHWNRDAEYYEVPWRGTWVGEAAGALFVHAIHAHDLLYYVLGPVAQVFALADTRVNEIETEDCAALAFRMENGALVTSSVTLGAGDDIALIAALASARHRAGHVCLPLASCAGQPAIQAAGGLESHWDRLLAFLPNERVTGAYDFLFDMEEDDTVERDLTSRGIMITNGDAVRILRFYLAMVRGFEGPVSSGDFTRVLEGASPRELSVMRAAARRNSGRAKGRLRPALELSRVHI